MDKTEANKRLAAIESEAEKLRALINEPEQPGPKLGELYRGTFGTYVLAAMNNEYQAVDIYHGYRACGTVSTLREAADGLTRLGTFNEVYVERSKIEEEYVTREELQDFLRGDCSEAASSVRMKLSDRFEIDY